jgi:hypothetical protein
MTDVHRPSLMDGRLPHHNKRADPTAVNETNASEVHIEHGVSPVLKDAEQPVLQGRRSCEVDVPDDGGNGGGRRGAAGMDG